MTPKAALPARMKELVELFKQNADGYHSGKYKEAQLRQEFIDPMFHALGWDMENKQRFAEAYKEVVHEDAINVGGSARAPDYAFRIGGIRKFFVEVKAPDGSVHSDEAAFQLRRYGWSAKLPISILTDFEHFYVYDTRIRPEQRDAASKARILAVKLDELEEKWDDVAGKFSKTAVLRGAFDSFVTTSKDKKGTAEVDAVFLQEIEDWREVLAKHLKKNNQDLTQQELNSAVQTTIDRIIFLRICEDRGIEPYGRLLGASKKTKAYAALMEIFREADKKYNSGLFHFEEEPGRGSSADRLTPKLLVDDAILQRLVRRLYYPDSPYEFSILPAEILGQVYEQFLGKVIVVTEKQARIEEKPEVKKAGGVYYTPAYIVQFIVENTIGKLVAGLTPDQASKIKIVDPACGSGSFLLVAYQFLLDWYLQQYSLDPKKWKDRITKVGPKSWILTVEERKRILLANIFGVDIDTQAVEVTKLSLLLKVLEKTSKEVLDNQLKLFHSRALPDLDSNIKCGNTLLDYRHLGQTLLDDDTRRRVNPFDWKKEFPEIVKAGGFDAVIGNPPYIRVQTMTEWAPLEVELYKRHYAVAAKGNYDIYVCFLERGLWLLNEKGKLGYILPHKFFNAQYGESIRGIIANGKHLNQVVHFGDQQVFENATTYTCLLFLDKSGSPEVKFEKVGNLAQWRLDKSATTTGTIPANGVTANDWNFQVGEGSALFDKLATMTPKLKDIASNMFQGLVTSSDPVYLLEPVAPLPGGLVKVKSKQTGQEYELETSVCRPLCKGSRDISRYVADPSKIVLFPYDAKKSAESGKTVLIPESEFAKTYPRAWAYLNENKEVLRNREKGKMRHDGWYGYVYPKSVALFAKPKILTPSIASSASYSLDAKGQLYFVGSGGGGGGGYGIILNEDCTLDPRYVLGLLNSKLVDAFLKKVSSTFRGGYYAYNRQYIEQLPIRTINFSNAAEKGMHDRVVALVDQALDLHKQLSRARADHESTSIQRQIDAIEDELDKLVLQLYDVKPAEMQGFAGNGA